jgi:hypothetical protein
MASSKRSSFSTASGTVAGRTSMRLYASASEARALAALARRRQSLGDGCAGIRRCSGNGLAGLPLERAKNATSHFAFAVRSGVAGRSPSQRSQRFNAPFGADQPSVRRGSCGDDRLVHHACDAAQGGSGARGKIDQVIQAADRQTADQSRGERRPSARPTSTIGVQVARALAAALREGLEHQVERQAAGAVAAARMANIAAWSLPRRSLRASPTGSGSPPARTDGWRAGPPGRRRACRASGTLRCHSAFKAAACSRAKTALMRAFPFARYRHELRRTIRQTPLVQTRIAFSTRPRREYAT